MARSLHFDPVLFSLLLTPLVACGSESPADLRERASEVFTPLSAPPTPATEADRERIDLGYQLFFDAEVSVDGSISCASCHLPQHWGADARPQSLGINGAKTPRNAPTVINCADQIAQHWRGDRASLEEQAERALTGGLGNMNPDDGLARLKNAGYETAFQAAFPDNATPLSVTNYGAAVAAYERTLISTSRFDDFLLGDDAALLGPEIDGLAAFLDLGCANCHTGPLLGGKSYAKFGVVRPYAEATGSPTTDEGRFDVTKQEADRFVFKVPNLRDVEHTAPYFHDGSVEKLEDAIRVMADVQLGKELDDTQVTALVFFLRTLSAPVPVTFNP
jgi:cytochrome c peroxidase